MFLIESVSKQMHLYSFEPQSLLEWEEHTTELNELNESH